MSQNDNFLNLLKNKLDKYQDEALHIEENAVIAAGAGSGKTQVLATRFAWLIMTGKAKVEEILTLTFTNKAASEMYQRIYDTLKKFAEHPVDKDLSEENKKLAQTALENFSYAHIQTLDSYCASIVRQCANRYGIKPDFTAGTSDSEREIKNKAFDYILKNAENPALQYFVKAGKLQDFAENTFAPIIINHTSLATKPHFFETKLENQKTEIVKQWNSLINGKVTNSLYDYSLLITREREDAEKKGTKGKEKYLKMVLELENNLRSYKQSLEITENDISNQNEKLMDKVNKIKELYKFIKTIPTQKDYISSIRAAIKPLKENEIIPSICEYINQYSLILEFTKLLDNFLIQINSAKRISGKLTFFDISELALKILLENEDIRNQEKNAYKKIMIDEFQDNNGKNRDLLYLLALKKGEFEDNGKCVIDLNNLQGGQPCLQGGQPLHKVINRDPEKLFFVGDEKQSIYKFRGAEVSVFNELADENKTVQMTYNYRSTPELLSAFNTIFKNGNGIFENPLTNTDGKKEYEAYYVKDAEKNGTQLPKLTAQNCPIHIHGLFTNEIPDSKKDYLPDWDQIGYETAKKIYEIGSKTGNWSNIAILDKSRSHRTNITKYLNMFGIPYQLDAQKDIFTDAIINDIYNFLRLCVYPSDLNALATYLCSPFTGLSENSVEKVLSYKIIDDNIDAEQINQRLKAELSESEYTKYVTAILFFDEYKPLVLKQKITTTLSYLWNNKGYKYETMLSSETQLCAEHFDLLFEIARQADENGQTISWFIDQLALLKSTYSKSDSDLNTGDISYPLEREQSVKFMTIHKSKGLEFDYVFILGCTSVTLKSENANFFFTDKYGLSIKPDSESKNYFAIIQKELSKQMELAEFRRVIYVAITRAKKEVYLMCNYNKPEKDSTSISRLFENMILSRYPNPTSDSDFPFFEDAGFDYTPIIPLKYQDINQKQKENLSIDVIRNAIIQKTENKYSEIKTISFESNPIPRNTPSGLEKDFSPSQSSEIFDSDSGEKYEQSDDTLQDGNFTAADFGTLVHSYLEMQAKGINPNDYEPEPKLFKKLDEKQRNENKEICLKMCKEFLESECGQQLETSKKAGLFYRAEWGFRMFLDGTIFTGSIDLIYQNADGTYTIVDYKSDNQINSEKYFEQQMCYKKAAAKLLKIDEGKISNYLYFLKHKETVKL